MASVIAMNSSRIISVALQMRMLTLLAFMTVCSALWSQDPVRSSYSGLFYLISTLFAFYLVIHFETKEIMTLVMMTGTVVCVLGLMMVLLFPQYALDHVDTRSPGAWVGVFSQRNHAAKCLTYLMTPALVFGYSRVTYRRLAYVLLVGAFIVKAHVVTALVLLTLYPLCMIALCLVRRLDGRSALITVSLVSIVCIVAVIASTIVLPELLQRVGRDTTLTGRTVVWDVLLRSMVKQPLLGYGFYSFWLGMKGESANVIVGVHWFFGYAHNGLLEIALQLGVVGVAVFLITFIQAIKDAWCCIQHGASAELDWYIGIIILAVLYNIDEATVVLPNDLLSVLYIVACCGLSMKARELRNRARTSSELWLDRLVPLGESFVALESK
jgi:O-antigen ligase